MTAIRHRFGHRITTGISNVRGPLTKSPQRFRLMHVGTETTPSFSIAKAVGEDRLVFGYANVCVADGQTFADLQGDIIDPAELERGAYGFMLEFQRSGEMHKSASPSLGQVVESMVFTDEKLAALGLENDVAKHLLGRWWLGVKVTPEVFDKVKSGEYRMFSIQGNAERESGSSLIERDSETLLAEHRQTLVGDLAELDEQIMMLYLDGQDISVSQIKAAIRRLTVSNRVVPVLCGSALRDKGIELLLDAIVDYLPSPLDVPAISATDPRNGEKVLRGASDETFFCISL